MSAHAWGCDVDRSQQYGEPINPTCTCGVDPSAAFRRVLVRISSQVERRARAATAALYEAGVEDRRVIRFSTPGVREQEWRRTLATLQQIGTGA